MIREHGAPVCPLSITLFQGVLTMRKQFALLAATAFATAWALPGPGAFAANDIGSRGPVILAADTDGTTGGTTGSNTSGSGTSGTSGTDRSGTGTGGTGTSGSGATGSGSS